MIIEKLWRRLVLRRLEKSGASAELAAQAGKVVHLRAGAATLAMRIDGQGVPAPVHPGITPAATLAFDLGSILRGKGKAPHAEGDSELLAALGALKSRLDVGAMDLFEEACGENAASAATLAGQWARDCGGDARRRFERNLRNWLENESAMFVTRSQLAELASETERLAAQAASLSARADALAAQEGPR